MSLESRRRLVLDCPLFEGRAFQYGPACAVARRLRRRFLVYYPLGSGKTLSAIHAARTFLERKPNGKIIILTTLSNVSSTWSKNIRLYLDHVSDKNNGIANAQVHNIQWWFSQNNPRAHHYNKLIQALSTNKLSSRTNLINMDYKQLYREKSRYHGRIREQTIHKLWNEFKSQLTETQKRDRQSFLQATIPEGPYFLIVDECQQFINLSGESLLVNALAHHAWGTLLLSATPIFEQSQQRGLRELLGLNYDDNIRASILWTNDRSEKPRIIDKGVRKVTMSTQEWATHQTAKRAMSAIYSSEDAYRTKTRQACNCDSKWDAISAQLDADCETFANAGGPVRMVVYSFYLDNGVEGFLHYLQTQKRGRMNSKNRFKYMLDDVPVYVSLMNEDTLAWFNRKPNPSKPSHKILLISSRSGTGISLKNVRAVHIMEPQWTYADEEQAIGRCTRKNSHTLVEKKLEVTRWVAVHPRGTTADQHVRARMLEKKRQTDVILNKFKNYGDETLRSLLDDFERS